MNGTTWSGGVFHPDVPSGRAGCELSLTPQGVRARSATGQSFELPYAQMRIDMGGASGKMLLLRGAGELTLFSEDKGLFNALRYGASPDVRRTMEQLRATRSRRRMWALGISGALIALIVLAVMFAPAMLRSVAKFGVKRLPFSIDQKIGELASGEVAAAGAPVKQPQVVQPIQAMVALLARYAPRPAGLDSGAKVKYRVKVVEATQINAFALPGGQIVVYTGLLKLAESPDQVAGVLAHEMSHVYRRHGLQRIAQSVGVVGAVQLLVGDVGGLAGLVAQLFTVAAINNYSREHESQADADAVALLAKVGIDADALANFLQLLQSEQASPQGKVQWFSSHPDTAARVRAIRELARSLPRPSNRKGPDWAADWAKLKVALGQKAITGASSPGGG